MRQLLLPGRLAVGQRIAVRDADYHYLIRVRRHAVDDELEVVDEYRNRATVRIISVNETSADLQVLSLVHGPGDFTEIVVYQALPKGRKLDDVIRVLVQAGVCHLVPVETERTVVRIADLGNSRMERWNRIAREAVQQSGSDPVRIASPVPLADAIREAGSDSGIHTTCSLFLHTEPLAHSSLHGYLGTAVSRLVLFVGPEGGFTPAECDQFIAAGVQPLWLGPRVYRTEVAGLAAVAAAQLLLVESEEWQLMK